MDVGTLGRKTSDVGRWDVGRADVERSRSDIERSKLDVDGGTFGLWTLDAANLALDFRRCTLDVQTFDV